ncbi:MAG TPA: hypothetical protein VFD52_05290 [Clostridia bacterium]|nr:hypothetical protein [Clostridia bacterium]
MKKTICVVLSIVFSLTCWLPVIAVNECNCGNTPLIFVTGMNSSPLYLDHATEYEKTIFPPTANDIIGTIGKASVPLISNLVGKNWDGAFNSLVDCFDSMFEYIKCNPDGTSKHDIFSFGYDGSAASNDRTGVLSSTKALGAKAAEQIGDDHVYAFVYDWRLDPMEHAVELNNFVQNVKDETNHSKVSFISISMGGIVTAAYLHLFGSGDLENLVMLSSAFFGVEMIGDILTGRFDIDIDGVVRLICQNLKRMPLGNLFSCVLKTMNKVCVFDSLQCFLDDFVHSYGDRMLEDVVKPLFSYMPSVWGLIPEKDYDEAKSLLLDENENAALIEKIDYYHYNVRLNVENIINDAISNGTNFYVISSYNSQGVPIGEGNDLHSDTVIDTIYTSAGATCAPIGETLIENYVQAIGCGHNHLSPDRIIDASTCKWPEQTWFVKNMTHVGQTISGNNTEFYLWLAKSDEQCYIHSNSDFPQFLEFDYSSGNIIKSK